MGRATPGFRIRRRYMRSINLERDAELADSLEGYLLTPRAIETFERVLQAYVTPNVTRAWTLTGVYGTGKSAFANFVASLFAGSSSEVRQAAERLLNHQPAGQELARKLKGKVPDDGLVRALVTARREPLSNTLVRALARGAEDFWAGRRGRKPKVVQQIYELHDSVLNGDTVSATELPELTHHLAQASRNGLLIVIDELGKLLEHAGRSGGSDDLFLLQQLAELPAEPDQAPVMVLGLLHQAFSEYGHLLSSSERAEWDKVQGRFEDIPFSESPDQLIRLMADAIEANLPRKLTNTVRCDAEAWHHQLSTGKEQEYFSELLPAERIAQVFPLHPVVALALPVLCTRYGQHDRSLFTFLTSNEPHALGRFIEEQAIGVDHPRLLQLPAVYDYFIDSAKVAGTGRVQLNRWAEVHAAVRDAAGMGSDVSAALKVIGTLNLIGSSGPMRARHDLVLAALASRPQDEEEQQRWKEVLDELVARRVIVYRQQVDEYRIWQGSDFDVDGAIEVRLEAERRPLSAMLEDVAPLTPIVAQRHSYKTGTLRFFERRYIDDLKDLARLECRVAGSAGTIAYWVGPEVPNEVPGMTVDGKPLVVTAVEPRPAFVAAVRELLALQQVQRKEPALQTDGVARKEVIQRLDQAREVLDDALRIALDRASTSHSWFGGHKVKPKTYNTRLSELCDAAYAEGPILWNEIINRRELTSQGARAQREVIAALLVNSEKDRLGIEGTGPEFSIYSSLLKSPGIHHEDDNGWSIGPPADTGIRGLWTAIERFCLEAVDAPRPISDLFDILQSPPYGAGAGIIPVYLAAVLMYHADDVSLYQDGTFSPTLTPPQFELLVKHPQRFAVKYFELSGIRWQLFKEIEAVVKASGAKRPDGRNATLLTVVRPLVRFAVSLPSVTKQAKDLSPEAGAVLRALLSGKEPDRLIFEDLPIAVGQRPFKAKETSPAGGHQEFRRALFAALRELQQHYDEVLGRCQAQIHEAFGVRASVDHLREDLRVRASYMAGKVIDRRMNSLIVAAVDEERSDRDWLEALVMIIADRPADNWTPQNKLAFELNLTDFARRFRNLEALQREATRETLEGFEAKRITITSSTGEEAHRLVWIAQQHSDKIATRAEQLLAQLDDIDDEHRRQAVLMKVVERVFSTSSEETTRDIEPAPTPLGKEAKHG